MCVKTALQTVAVTLLSRIVSWRSLRAARLALLDQAFAVRCARRSFVDDTRVAIASWSQAAVAMGMLEHAAVESNSCA